MSWWGTLLGFTTCTSLKHMRIWNQTETSCARGIQHSTVSWASLADLPPARLSALCVAIGAPSASPTQLLANSPWASVECPHLATSTATQSSPSLARFRWNGVRSLLSVNRTLDGFHLAACCKNRCCLRAHFSFDAFHCRSPPSAPEASKPQGRSPSMTPDADWPTRPAWIHQRAPCGPGGPPSARPKIDRPARHEAYGCRRGQRPIDLRGQDRAPPEGLEANWPARPKAHRADAARVGSACAAQADRRQLGKWLTGLRGTGEPSPMKPEAD